MISKSSAISRHRLPASHVPVAIIAALPWANRNTESSRRDAMKPGLKYRLMSYSTRWPARMCGSVTRSSLPEKIASIRSASSNQPSQFSSNVSSNPHVAMPQYRPRKTFSV